MIHRCGECDEILKVPEPVTRPVTVYCSKKHKNKIAPMRFAKKKNPDKQDR